MSSPWQAPGQQPGVPQPPPGPWGQQGGHGQQNGYGQQGGYGQAPPYAQPYAQPYGQPGANPYAQQGYGPYGAPPGAYGAPVRPSRGLAVAALVLAGVFLLAVVLRALTAFSAAEQYRDATLAGGSAVDVLTGYDTVGLMLFPAMLAAYVVTCCWLVRARANSEAMTPHQPTRARGWIWAGWLVPVVALWFPFQVVRDVLRAGRPGAGALLGWWWATWLVGQGLQSSASRLMGFDGTVDPSTIGLLGPLESASALLLAVSFVLWCLVVTTVVRDQEARVR